MAEVTQVERRAEHVRAELLGWLRTRRLEAPTSGRVERMVRSALQRGETALMERLCALLSANAQIFYGKAGDIASNRRDEQEMSVLCLHIVQAAMVHINTLIIQNVLRDPEWSAALSKTDYRALTPLFWAHAAMHGEFKLNMRTRMTIDSATSAI